MPLKILHISGDVGGGAARAAWRLHNSLCESSEIESNLIVRGFLDDDAQHLGIRSSYFGKIYLKIIPLLDRLPARLQFSYLKVPRSSGCLGSISLERINNSSADIVHLHWICAGFLSIEQIGKISKPVVWSLHDMWPFCGAEHIAGDGANARWRQGYSSLNRDSRDKGIDIDKWVWRRKQIAWARPLSIVAPSKWMADCAKSSMLMRGWNVAVVPNPLNVEIFKSINKEVARKELNLPLGKKLIIFGAIRGTQLSYKGWDLLLPALKLLINGKSDYEVVIFGERAPQNPPDLGFNLHWIGHVENELELAKVYSAADVVVVPSRQESFGQVASEAQACGCPVVAFRSTGLIDVIEHRVTGFLAEPFSIQDLAAGIEWVLSDESRYKILSNSARSRAVSLWSYDAVALQFMEIYQNAIRTQLTGDGEKI